MGPGYEANAEKEGRKKRGDDGKGGRKVHGVRPALTHHAALLFVEHLRVCEILLLVLSLHLHLELGPLLHRRVV